MNVANKMNTERREIFGLRLAGGQNWSLIGEGAQRHLVRHLADVMCLSPLSMSHRDMQLCFTDTVEGRAELPKENMPIFSDRRMQVWWQPDCSSVKIEILNIQSRDDQYMIMRTAMQMIQHLNAMRGGLPLHSAIAELEGAGVLLAARGGTGKSTCCQRFPEYWNVLGDDETLLVKDSGEYIAHPLPTWSYYRLGIGGKTWASESSTPVKAVFFLEQAEVDEVIPVSRADGGLRLYASLYPAYRWFWYTADIFKKREVNTLLFHNACNMGFQIPAFVLRVSLHGHFWKLIESVLVGTILR